MQGAAARGSKKQRQNGVSRRGQSLILHLFSVAAMQPPRRPRRLPSPQQHQQRLRRMQRQPPPPRHLPQMCIRDSPDGELGRFAAGALQAAFALDRVKLSTAVIAYVNGFTQMCIRDRFCAQ